MTVTPVELPPPPPPIPAPPRRPREDPWRRRGRWLTSAVLTGIVATTVVLLNVQRPPRGDQDVLTAERFADNLRYGNADSPLEPGKNGYQAAFDLLSALRQEDVGFGGFVATFDDLVAHHGLLQATKRIERESGRARSRHLFFHLIYSGTQGERELVELALTVEPDGREFRIADFRVAPLGRTAK